MIFVLSNLMKTSSQLIRATMFKWLAWQIRFQKQEQNAGSPAGGWRQHQDPYLTALKQHEWTSWISIIASDILYFHRVCSDQKWSAPEDSTMMVMVKLTVVLIPVMVILEARSFATSLDKPRLSELFLGEVLQDVPWKALLEAIPLLLIRGLTNG